MARDFSGYFAGVTSTSEALQRLNTMSGSSNRRAAKDWIRHGTGLTSVIAKAKEKAAITQPFQQAIDTLSGATGDVEKMYQAGKRRTMGNVAMQSIQSGMANTLNMPAAGIAYDEANRPATNLGIASTKAGVYQNLGQAAAGMYSTDVGAATSRYATDVGSSTALGTAGIGAAASQANSLRAAQTARTTANLQFQSNQANQALKKYIADLQHGGSSGSGALAGAPTV
ncbi:MAG: hypothetical protein GQ565_02935 [Candidatus Aegiribacteria sp.]|nr:hypothetical protein [Candidatus Aegiribacteria sp.]